MAWHGLAFGFWCCDRKSVVLLLFLPISDFFGFLDSSDCFGLLGLLSGSVTAGAQPDQ
jgi:hypothetical protein